LPKFSTKTPNVLRRLSNPKGQIYYRSSSKAWPGFTRSQDFAVRYTGFLVIPKTLKKKWTFGVQSDDGSNLYINKKKWVSNDGLHGSRFRKGQGKLVKGQHQVRLEYFEKGGKAGLVFMYKAPGSRSFARVDAKILKYQVEHGLKEEIFYVSSKNGMPNLNKNADAMRVVPTVNYASTKANWKGFTKNDNFAVRWSGDLQITRKGGYKFSLVSDDGSRLFLDGKYIVNNDGAHGMRNKEGRATLRQRSYAVLLEYFEKTGNAGMIFRYMGPGTGGMRVVPAKVLTARFASTKTPEPKSCKCIPCGSRKPKAFGKGKCGPKNNGCNGAKGTAKSGCYSSQSTVCDCKTLKAALAVA